MERTARTLKENLRNPEWVKDWFDQAGFQAATEIERLENRIEKLESGLSALSSIRDSNPSDAMADMPELDYARHMLYEARQLAKETLAE